MSRKTMSRRSPIATLLVVAAAALLAPGPASAAVQGFRNATPIAIPGTGTKGPASPFPSSLSVSAMTGPITRVGVTLHGVSHPEPHQMRVALVSPSGTAVALMDLDCGSQDIVGASLVFSQAALAELPSNGPCDGNAYRPGGHRSTRIPWPSPAPIFASPGLDLDEFAREDPNGTWQLHVDDVSAPYTGEIAGGWTLTVETFDGPIDMLVPEVGTSGVASTYPSTRTVSDQVGVISDVNVGIKGIWHTNAFDLDMLLVGPAGQKIVLTSDACGDSPIGGLNWSFDDEAAAPLPHAGPCTSGSYRPADYAPEDSWPTGTPPEPYATSLAAFDGTDPNGEWQLFVNDDFVYDVGFIANRFPLSTTTRPKAAVAFTESAVTMPEGATRALVVRRSAPGALGAGAVTVTSTPRSARSGSDFTPVSTTLQFAADEAEKTFQLKALTDLPMTGAPRSTPGRSSSALPARHRRTSGGPHLSPLSARNRTHRACRRYVAAGTLRRNGLAGANRVAFNGRIGRRALRPGSYRLVVAAVDPDGNRSTSRPRTFRIVT